MLSLVLVAALAQSPSHRLFKHPSLPRANYAFFEALPATSAGATYACACSNLTGARGETSSTVRANSLDCRKGGPWVTTGIAVGDVVTCSSNLPRVTVDGAGVLGIEAWGGFVQGALRTDELDNVAWTSVEAPTANAATAPDGTASVAEQLNDTSGALQRCTTQTIATTSATVQQASVYVRAGTLDQAQLKLTGTGSATGDCTATSTSLSSTTWTRLWCQSPAAYAGTLTAITISVCVGDAAGDTGTVMAWRANWSAAQPTLGYPNPSVQAVSSAVTSNYERVTFTLPVAMSASTGSHAASFTPAWSTPQATPHMAPQLIYYDGNGRPIYGPGAAPTAVRQFDGLNDVSNTYTSLTAGAVVRMWSSYTGSTSQVNDGTDTTTGSFDGTLGAAALTSLQVGGNTAVGTASYGVVSRVCADPDPTRCR